MIRVRGGLPVNAPDTISECYHYLTGCYERHPVFGQYIFRPVLAKMGQEPLGQWRMHRERSSWERRLGLDQPFRAREVYYNDQKSTKRVHHIRPYFEPAFLSFCYWWHGGKTKRTFHSFVFFFAPTTYLPSLAAQIPDLIHVHKLTGPYRSHPFFQFHVCKSKSNPCQLKTESVTSYVPAPELKSLKLLIL